MCSGSASIRQTEQEQEVEDLRKKLTETEERLSEAQRNWEQRFMENKQKQMRELAEAEKRKEELESHELEGVLSNNFEEAVEKKLTKADVTASMNQIFDIMATLRPAADDVEENVKLLFARVNKLLQAFETPLNNSLSKATNQKSVTFKI